MISISVDDKTLTSVARIKGLPARLIEQITRTMEWVLIDLQSYIVTQKLQGQVLRHRSGHLGRSIIYDFTKDDNGVYGIVGIAKEAPYGKTHELGGTFQVPEHLAHWRKGPAHGQIRTPSWTVRAHSATFPPRSFLRSALAEKADSIKDKFAEDIDSMVTQ